MGMKILSSKEWRPCPKPTEMIVQRAKIWLYLSQLNGAYDKRMGLEDCYQGWSSFSCQCFMAKLLSFEGYKQLEEYVNRHY